MTASATRIGNRERLYERVLRHRRESGVLRSAPAFRSPRVGPSGSERGEPVSYAAVSSAEVTSPKFADAFALGCGGGHETEGRLVPGPVALFGSESRWAMLRQAQAEGRDWYYCDHAYWGRFWFYRVTRNAYQHDGIGEPTREAIERLGACVDAGFLRFKPWRTDGDHVLVCPPDGRFARLHGFSAEAWTENVVQEIRRRTSRPIVIRGRRASGVLADDLDGAWGLVTWVSNAAVDAVLAGIPAVCLGPCAARVMGSPTLDGVLSPRMPGDRERWAAVLAANQWTLDEIAAGDCWRAIGRA